MNSECEIIDIKVGHAIRALRVAKGMTQAEAATAVGITFQQWQKYEKAQNRVSAGRLGKIAELFKVSVSYFFEDELKEIDSGNLNKHHLAIMQSVAAIKCPKRLQYVKHTAKFMESWEKKLNKDSTQH